MATNERLLVRPAVGVASEDMLAAHQLGDVVQIVRCHRLRPETGKSAGRNRHVQERVNDVFALFGGNISQPASEQRLAWESKPKTTAAQPNFILSGIWEIWLEIECMFAIVAVNGP